MSRKNSPYFIAEVGQNHQGNHDLALEYIRVFSNQGADAIKFQTRDIGSIFSKEALRKPYNSENAFGSTYGKHRRYLEIPLANYHELLQECEKYNVDFISTAFDTTSLNFLYNLGLRIVKIASFDCGNIKLLKEAADLGFHIILSTGGHAISQVESIMQHETLRGASIDVLYCVSKYPTPYGELHLGNLTKLKRLFPDKKIGLSDHFTGILSGPLARALGAEVFEKHVTFDRSWKGSDHAFALEPEGFRKFARDTNRAGIMILDGESPNLGHEAVFKKLGKCIYATTNIKVGEEVSFNNIDSMIPGEHADEFIPVSEMINCLGKTLVKPVKAQSFLRYSDIVECSSEGSA